MLTGSNQNPRNDYRTYIQKADELFYLLKGKKSGRVGLAIHIQVAKEACTTLRTVVEDISIIQEQATNQSRNFSESQSFFSYFLDREKEIIVKAGGSAEFAQQWVTVARKLIDPATLKDVSLDDLELVIRQKLRMAEGLVQELEEAQELSAKNRRDVLRLCYVVGGIGVFGANSALLPSVVPILMPYGVTISQLIAGELIISPVGKLPGIS